MTYSDFGDAFGWYQLADEIQDEVELELLEGAKKVETADDAPAIELADGEICRDLYTTHHDGISQPLIYACNGCKFEAKKIFMKYRVIK